MQESVLQTTHQHPIIQVLYLWGFFGFVFLLPDCLADPCMDLLLGAGHYVRALGAGPEQRADQCRATPGGLALGNPNATRMFHMDTRVLSVGTTRQQCQKCPGCKNQPREELEAYAKAKGGKMGK